MNPYLSDGRRGRRLASLIVGVIGVGFILTIMNTRFRHAEAPMPKTLGVGDIVFKDLQKKWKVSREDGYFTLTYGPDPRVSVMLMGGKEDSPEKLAKMREEFGKEVELWKPNRPTTRGKTEGDLDLEYRTYSKGNGSGVKGIITGKTTFVYFISSSDEQVMVNGRVLPAMVLQLMFQAEAKA